MTPALLDELLSELSSLASVYHKPVETFIGRGRLGADEVQRKANEREDDMSKEKAIQTLVAGQHAENLLDIDDDMPTESPQLGQNEFSGSLGGSGKAAPVRQTANPLDDLLGLFDNAGLGGGPTSIKPTQMQTQNASPFDMLGSVSSMPSTSIQPTPATNGTGSKEVDLLDGLF